MADWRRLAKMAVIGNGSIDDAKVAIVRKELFADKRIDRSELEFLMQVSKDLKNPPASFEHLLFEAVRSVLLADASISAGEVAWLREWIFADGKVDEREKKLLKELKLLADSVCPEFTQFFNECMAQ